MIRFAALNYSSSEDDSQEAQERAATKEAEESEAFMLYNRALTLQRQGSNDKAEEAFKELLEHPFITEALELLGDNVEGSTHPALQLLYSIHKNIANMALNREDHKAAILSYIEAVKIDTSEVTVWYKIGTIAKQIYNFPLARMGFEVGLKCNPNHWPCLDNVITLLYAMNDYWYCLYYISKALEKDHGYTKGLVFRNQIYKEEPSLKETTINMFKDCDPVIDSVEIDREEIEEYINEALNLANERRKLARTKQPDMIKLPTPIQSYTWCCLGEALLALYRMLKSSNPPLSMGRRVDLSAYDGEVTPNIDISSEEQPMELDVAASKTTVHDLSVDEVAEQLDPQTVSSLEQFLSNLPEEQMTELLQSTPPMSTQVTTTLQQPICTSSPMETEEFESVNNIPIIITPEILSKENSGVSQNVNKDNTVQEILQKENIPLESLSQNEAGGDSLARNLFSAESLSKSKAPKRKKGNFPEDFGAKRRSARVRNTSKRKEEDCVNFQGLLLTFLPPKLRDYDEENSKESLQPLELASNSGVKASESEIVTNSLCDTEEADLRQLLLAMQKNCGCLDLMMQFMFKLSEKIQFKWPVGLSAVYLKVYKFIRNHFDLPDTCSDDEIDDNLLELGKSLLLYSEIQLDFWTVTKSRFLSSPRQAQSPGFSQLKESDLPSYYYDDEYFLAGMISRHDVFGAFWSEYCTRVYWMKARFFMLQGKMEDAVFFFKKTLSCLKDSTEVGSGEVVKIILPNCTVHNVLSIEKVEEQLKSLERSQSFDETQRLYDAGEYEQVVECLLKTSLNQVTTTTSATERRSQLSLLQSSLIKLEDYKRAFLWSEIALDEAVRAYKISTSSEKEHWTDTLVQTCESLTLILKKDKKALSDLPTVNQARLSHNLIYMIDIQMSVPESCTELPIGTVLPWILLYRLIKIDEKLAFKAADQIQSDELENTIPPSLMLLSIAHEYLGRHAWCTKSDGEFLLFYIGVLTSENTSSELFNEELGQAVEQCFYCLYGHPTKKGRYRHLVDHNASQIELTWERSEKIFEYFKPKTLPAFDSYKTDAVAGEVEQLLRKICTLVPESQKPVYVIDSLQDYIEGTTDMFDEESIYNPSPVSQDLYYLLGDYYFKNNDQAKAIKYYCNDICVNPNRLDSWAGMALARMSQLEQKLNSTELRMDFPVHKKSISALRCFRRALQIDEFNGKLWIEYGSLAYQLHSHSSRQLKWQESFPLSSELEQIATETRQEMLQTAYNCYKKVIEFENEEEWIQHYMIGKCLEKMKKTPAEFLRHYEEAAECLYEENAPYPKKIAYAYTTPHLAVEALEIFYRLHASILKMLLSKNYKHLPDSDCQLFERFVNKAAASPFACGKQKNEDSSENKDTAGMDGKADDQNKVSMSQDHTYSKQNSDKMSSILQKPIGITSLENSLQSCSDSASQESVYVSSESVSQSRDMSYNVSAGSSCQPMETDDSSAKHKQSSLQLAQDNGSLTGSVTTETQNQSETKTFELSAHEMIEEIATIKPIDSSDDIEAFTKLSQIDMLKKLDKGVDSPSSLGSSDIYEDEDGNITVTAKIEVIGRSSSSETEATQEKRKLNSELEESCDTDKGMVKVESRQSFGFEPMGNVEDCKKQMEPLQVNSDAKKTLIECTDESSQDIKESVGRTLGDIISTVDTVDSMVMKITEQSEEENLQIKQTIPEPVQAMEIKQANDEIKFDNKNQSSGKEENSTPAFSMETRTDSLFPDYTYVVSKDEPKSGADNFVVEIKGNITSLCPQYESMSSEDDELPDYQKDNKTTKSPDKQKVQLLANVSLCADYDSLSSENDEMETGEPEDRKNATALQETGEPEDRKNAKAGQETGEPEDRKNVTAVQSDDNTASSKLLDDGMFSEMGNVNVLEISQGGVSGDITMGQQKDNEVQGDIISANEEKSTDIVDEHGLGSVAVTEQTNLTKVNNAESLASENVCATGNVGEQQNVNAMDIDDEKQDPKCSSENFGIPSEEKDLQSAVNISGEENMVVSSNDIKSDENHTKPEKAMEVCHSEVLSTADEKLNISIEVTERTTIQEIDGSKSVEKDVKEEGKEMEKTEKDEKKTEENVNSSGTQLSGKTGEQLHKLLIEKCMAALHLCLSRFPTHYKSIYRLADVYVHSPYHKNLMFARDLLLGVPNWQQQSHMPAQGLFGERKQMNFFQGIWRIPIGDIDRSGSFASHMHRSVLLLLHVLKEKKELSLMYQIHLWMNRSPETGKKFLRDSERLLFVKMSFNFCWEIIDDRNKELDKPSETDKVEKILMEVYKIWNYGNSSKMRNVVEIDTNKIFAETYRAIMKDQVDQDRPLLKQAIDFCQHYNLLAKAQKINQEGQNAANKSDSFIFSPTRSPLPLFSPARQTPLQSPATHQGMNVSTPPPPKVLVTSAQASNSPLVITKQLQSPLATTAKSTEAVKTPLLRIDRPELVTKKIPQKSFIQSPSIQQKDPKVIPKKTVSKSIGNEPVVETLVGEITSASIFETLIANEFGSNTSKVKTSDEVDGTSKKKPTAVEPAFKKQTIVVNKPGLQPIICKVDDTRGGLNIMSPEFGSLEVLTPNTPCPDVMKFSVPSKDPKTKTTLVITKRKPPLNITEPIEISSSDDEVDSVKQAPMTSKLTDIKVSPTSRQQEPVSTVTLPASMLAEINEHHTSRRQDPVSTVTLPKSSTSEHTRTSALNSQQIQRSIIQLDLESGDDSIPSSSDSGSVYVPDESSDSIPSSPEPANLRLDEVTGLFIPPDVKFFNDNEMLIDDDDD